MSAVEIRANGDSGEPDVEDYFNNSNPDSLEDIPSTMVRSEELAASKSDVFYDRMIQSAGSTVNKGSPAKSSSTTSANAIRRAASVTGATSEDLKQYATIPGHMSPTISSRRRMINSDTGSLVLVTRKKSLKEKDKADSVSLPCTMTRPTPRENRACRKRIELSHRNHLDFPHEHYIDDFGQHHHHHDHHHHHHGEHGGHSHERHGHTGQGYSAPTTASLAHAIHGQMACQPHSSHSNSTNSSNNNSNNSSTSSTTSSHFGSHSNTNLSSSHHNNSNSGHHHSPRGSTSSNNHGSPRGSTSGSNHHGSPRGSSSGGGSNNHSQGSHSSNNPSSSNNLGASSRSSLHGYASEVSAEEYLTPLQRKDQVIRGLKEELKKTQRRLSELNSQMDEVQRQNSELDSVISQKEAEIESVKEEKNIAIGRMQERVNNTMQERSVDEEELREKICELNDLIRDRDKQAERQLADKRHEILELREKVEELEFNYEELVHVYEESAVNTKSMEKELIELKEELERREDEHQDMYLAMFQKGKQCHNFERQEELENIGREDPSKVMVDELITKLENTESQLGRWQTIKTSEIYTDATNRPESEADARLRFLRDSLYHYIMDPMNAMQHLKAMAGIVDFTHAQREQVERVLAQKEKGVVKGVKDKFTEKKKVVQFVFKEKREEVMDKIREHRSRRNSHH